MKIIKKLPLIITILLFSIFSKEIKSQTGFVETYSYNCSYGENNQFINSYYNNGRYCENWKKMIWTKHYGSHQVRMWDRYSGRWIYKWRTDYYYTFSWYYYYVCR